MEKIKKLKKQLIKNSLWDIIEEEGEYYAVDCYNQKWKINVDLREHLKKSYFHSPECDDDIIGYNPFTGAIIYDLWRVGKTEMTVSEGINSDFHDTGYGIGRLLFEFEKYGFGNKVPPIHILPPDFITYHSDLQSSIYTWGYDISLINSIGMKEHRRLDLKNDIEAIKKDIEENGSKWPEDVRNSRQMVLEDMIKEYNSI